MNGGENARVEEPPPAGPAGGAQRSVRVVDPAGTVIRLALRLYSTQERKAGGPLELKSHLSPSAAKSRVFELEVGLEAPPSDADELHYEEDALWHRVVVPRTPAQFARLHDELSAAHPTAALPPVTPTSPAPLLLRFLAAALARPRVGTSAVLWAFLTQPAHVLADAHAANPAKPDAAEPPAASVVKGAGRAVRSLFSTRKQPTLRSQAEALQTDRGRALEATCLKVFGELERGEAIERSASLQADALGRLAQCGAACATEHERLAVAWGLFAGSVRDLAALLQAGSPAGGSSRRFSVLSEPWAAAADAATSRAGSLSFFSNPASSADACPPPHSGFPALNPAAPGYFAASCSLIEAVVAGAAPAGQFFSERSMSDLSGAERWVYRVVSPAAVHRFRTKPSLHAPVVEEVVRGAVVYPDAVHRLRNGQEWAFCSARRAWTLVRDGSDGIQNLYPFCLRTDEHDTGLSSPDNAFSLFRGPAAAESSNGERPPPTTQEFGYWRDPKRIAVGDLLCVASHTGRFRDALVLRVGAGALLLHYCGHDAAYNEWLPCHSPRIAPAVADEEGDLTRRETDGQGGVAAVAKSFATACVLGFDAAPVPAGGGAEHAADAAAGLRECCRRLVGGCRVALKAAEGVRDDFAKAGLETGTSDPCPLQRKARDVLDTVRAAVWETWDEHSHIRSTVRATVTDDVQTYVREQLARATAEADNWQAALTALNSTDPPPASLQSPAVLFSNQSSPTTTPEFSPSLPSAADDANSHSYGASTLPGCNESMFCDETVRSADPLACTVKAAEKTLTEEKRTWKQILSFAEGSTGRVLPGDQAAYELDAFGDLVPCGSAAADGVTGAAPPQRQPGQTACEVDAFGDLVPCGSAALPGTTPQGKLERKDPREASPVTFGTRRREQAACELDAFGDPVPHGNASAGGAIVGTTGGAAHQGQPERTSTRRPTPEEASQAIFGTRRREQAACELDAFGDPVPCATAALPGTTGGAPPQDKPERKGPREASPATPPAEAAAKRVGEDEQASEHPPAASPPPAPAEEKKHVNDADPYATIAGPSPEEQSIAVGGERKQKQQSGEGNAETREQQARAGSAERAEVPPLPESQAPNAEGRSNAARADEKRRKSPPKKRERNLGSAERAAIPRPAESKAPANAEGQSNEEKRRKSPAAGSKAPEAAKPGEKQRAADAGPATQKKSKKQTPLSPRPQAKPGAKTSKDPRDPAGDDVEARNRRRLQRRAAISAVAASLMAAIQASAAPANFRQGTPEGNDQRAGAAVATTAAAAADPQKDSRGVLATGSESADRSGVGAPKDGDHAAADDSRRLKPELSLDLSKVARDAGGAAPPWDGGGPASRRASDDDERSDDLDLMPDDDDLVPVETPLEIAEMEARAALEEGEAVGRVVLDEDAHRSAVRLATEAFEQGVLEREEAEARDQIGEEEAEGRVDIDEMAFQEMVVKARAQGLHRKEEDSRAELAEGEQDERRRVADDEKESREWVSTEPLRTHSSSASSSSPTSRSYSPQGLSENTSDDLSAPRPPNGTRPSKPNESLKKPPRKAAELSVRDTNLADERPRVKQL
ncbi:hypothetical protein DIPPA_25814 [Diplonema papillatum]|nr:hypothetical protein DIPPA_25814 [Diplonema papillatum]